MLDWLENPDLRRRCQASLKKSEQRHVQTQAICTFRQGRIIDRTHETLQYRTSGLNLVIAAIVYWNSTYIADAVQHLRSIGETPDPALLAHTSPVGWEHIVFPATSCGIGRLNPYAASPSISQAMVIPAKRSQMFCLAVV